MSAADFFPSDEHWPGLVTISDLEPISPPDSSAPRTQVSKASCQSATEWLDSAQVLVLARQFQRAAGVLQTALLQHRHDPRLQLALAGVRWQLKDHDGAQALLEEVLARQPDHVAAAFTLGELHIQLDRPQSAETVFLDLFNRSTQPDDLVLRAAKSLAACGRKQAAVELCENAIAAGSTDSTLHVYAAALQGQLGEFARSRKHYLFALDHDLTAVDAGAAYGLASITRYDDPDHPDLLRYKRLLERADLRPEARASLLFALAKAQDDLGDYPSATHSLRAGNAQVDHRSWSRKNWRRVVEARLRGTSLPQRRPESLECIPVFVLGAPRSGTTLVAELLGRSPEVCNRGELDWLPHLAEQVARTGKADIDLLDRVANAYLGKLRQGDSSSRWFIDKQPFNFLHVDLIRALFPQACIVHCRRNDRDTALSIWSQHFGSTEYRFAYDFGDIAAVLDGRSRLMDKARRDSAGPWMEVRYEDLVRDPQSVVAQLAASLGVAPFDCGTPKATRSVIGTASVWQARQPVYTRAVGRWRAYADFLPELLQFKES